MVYCSLPVCEHLPSHFVLIFTLRLAHKLNELSVLQANQLTSSAAKLTLGSLRNRKFDVLIKTKGGEWSFKKMHVSQNFSQISGVCSPQDLSGMPSQTINIFSKVKKV